MDKIIATLVMTHITIVCVTLYLHRGQAHKGIIFHPILGHFMRLWLWLTTGMVTKQWVAIHRKHHAYSDKEGDPHSPHVFGIWKVFSQGALLYSKAAKDVKMVEQFGVGTPDDWLERNVYTRFNCLGITLLLVLNLLCFSWWGLLIWGVQMIWIPLWAAGVINGLGHWWGYRNGETRERSKNLFPWGILIGGEELHNNHHLDPGSPKLSRRWFEFDVGWAWLSLLRLSRLASLRN
jgi:stearoyl-CoA desaturase (Delta-9 desaturase)